MPRRKIQIGPQPGPQFDFLSTPADIAIYGGAAGGGKSFALLLEPMRHYENPRFGGVVFRRNTVQVRNEGGLWDEAEALYSMLQANLREAFLEAVFPSGARVKFSHLEHERSVFDWQGSQIPYIGFDELTHFTEKQFFYMLSRNRSTSGVRPYVRATCNPDADSWVRKFVDWWIGEDGLPVKERAGVLRYFIRQDDEIIWADTAQELIAKYGDAQIPKSVTFIPSSVRDNKILMVKDPGYLSNLMALPRIDRLRLLGGNWNVRPSAGMFFQREWFEIIDAMPTNVIRTVRAWDKAATRVTPESPNPDWTRGCKMARLDNGQFVIMDMASLQGSPGEVETLVRNVTSQDGHDVASIHAQDPGSAGVHEVSAYMRLLAGYHVKTVKPSSNKANRAKPLSAQCEFGNVKLLRGPWTEAFLTEAENFDGEGKNKDDQIDAASDAFNDLCGDASVLDAY